MTRRPSLRVTLTLAIFGACIASLSALAAGPPSSRSTCEQLAEWAAPYRDSTPALAALQQYDRAHRAAMFSAVSPAAKAALWRAQFEHLAARPELTAEQRGLAREGLALITPSLYQEGAAKQRMTELWARVEPAFDREMLRAWTDIGLSEKNPVRTNREATCNCRGATATYDCPFSGVCFSGGCTLLQACGPAGTGICNGLCG